MFNLDGTISELPVFWEATTKHGYIRQIGDDGTTSHHYSELLPDDVLYYGLVSAQGRFGFSKDQNAFVVNDIVHNVGLLCGNSERTKIVNPLLGTLNYRRSVICDPSTNWQITKLVEIKMGMCILCITLIPEFLVNIDILPN